MLWLAFRVLWSPRSDLSASKASVGSSAANQFLSWMQPKTRMPLAAATMDTIDGLDACCELR